MQLSTRGRYAVMAMVELATRETGRRSGDLVCLADIAGRQQLSQSYLEQLFAKLRRADLVCSARGPGGGYRLARPACKIAISEIVAAVDEPIRATRCETGSGGCMVAAVPPGGGEMCQTHDLWAELGRQIALFLCGITLADVVHGRVSGRAVCLPPLKPAPAPAAARPGENGLPGHQTATAVAGPDTARTDTGTTDAGRTDAGETGAGKADAGKAEEPAG